MIVVILNINVNESILHLTLVRELKVWSNKARELVQ